MNKIMYYYYEKFPTSEIKEFKVSDVYYIIKEDDKDYKQVYGIDTYYDVTYERYKNDREYSRTYFIYAPYEDKDIYEYDYKIGSIVMSFNKEKLKEYWLNDIKRYETIHGKYVDEARKILGDDK